MSTHDEIVAQRRATTRAAQARVNAIRQLLEQIDPDDNHLRVEAVGDRIHISGDFDHIERVLRGIVE